MAGQIKVQLQQISATTTEATMGAHVTLVDRPPEKGGAGLGPMGGELFLAAVGGCFMSNLLAAIRARDLPIGGVRMQVVGVVADAPPRFEALEVGVTADSGELESLRHAAEIADRGCLLMNTLRGKLEVRITVERR